MDGWVGDMAEHAMRRPLRRLACMQVITSAEFHPHQCNVFAYSSSKGCIRLADMRNAALCDKHAKAFEEVESQASAWWRPVVGTRSDLSMMMMMMMMMDDDVAPPSPSRQCQ